MSGTGEHYPHCDYSACGGCRPVPVLRSGYAYRSSKRHPREPEHTIPTSAETAGARYVGSAMIDGRPCDAFRAGRVYFFQLTQGS